jgi:hypothetical protein
VTPEKESTEDWLREKIQNTIEDSLRIWRNNVAALAHTPGDWVEDPKEGSE